MFDIAVSVRLKVENNFQENIEKAQNKCLEAKLLVKRSLENKDVELMYKAVETYIEALTFFPRLIEPYLSIAFICEKLKMFDQALMILNKAFELEPFNTKVKVMLQKVKESRKTSKFNTHKENYIGEKEFHHSKVNKKVKKGIFNKIADFFSFSNVVKSSKIIPEKSPELKKEDFAIHFELYKQVVKKQEIKVVVNKNTLNQLNSIMSEKPAVHQKGLKELKPLVYDKQKESGKFNFDMGEKIKALEKLKENVDKHTLKVKVDERVFRKMV